MITLDPIQLIPPLTAADFTDPFVLSLTLTAEVTNTGWQGVNLLNTPEAVVSNISLSMERATTVPEPSSLLLLGSGLAALRVARRKRQKRLGAAG